VSLRLERFHAFARAQLPPPPARLLEIGCGDGTLARRLAADGYDVVAIDPNAPDGEPFRRVAFEDFEDHDRFHGVVASLSLHHVSDLHAAVDRIAELLVDTGPLVAQEWAKEKLTGETARWYHGRLLDRPHDHAHAVPDELSAFQAQSADRLADVHTFSAVRAALARRFDELVVEWVPYLYSHGLEDAVEPAERAAIDRSEIDATGVLYAGRAQMADATISRVRMRDLARPGRSRSGVGDLVAPTI
jgi:SAM-dependent methyltransferase